MQVHVHMLSIDTEKHAGGQCARVAVCIGVPTRMHMEAVECP